MKAKDVVLGTGILGYGLLKVFVGGTAAFATEEQKHKITKAVPPMKKFYSDDESVANKGLEVAFVLFGLFSVLHGLHKFHLLSHAAAEWLERPATETLVYAVLGVGLTAFYTAVVYTDLPIQKDPANIPHYKLLGITSGLSFLIYLPYVAIMQEMAKRGSLKGVWNSSSSGRLQIAIFTTMLATMVRLVVEGVDSKSVKQDVASLMTIIATQF